MTYSEIHVWGDSIARGIIYDELRGRYAISCERCTARLQAALSVKVQNHANMGATILDGLQCFQAFTPVPNALCAIEFGGNDCDLDWANAAAHPREDIVPKVSLALYAQTLSTFVAKVRAGGMVPLLVTPSPLHAERYLNWVTRGLDRASVLTALGDVNHIYRWHERYAIAMRTVAAQCACQLLDIRDVFLAQPNFEALLCVDGIHPSHLGHRLIADTAVALCTAPASSAAC
ncbi:MAG: SGNH/GDSL hydrolase family protein [Clostridia bacterium]